MKNPYPYVTSAIAFAKVAHSAYAAGGLSREPERIRQLRSNDAAKRARIAAVDLHEIANRAERGEWGALLSLFESVNRA